MAEPSVMNLESARRTGSVPATALRIDPQTHADYTDGSNCAL